MPWLKVVNPDIRFPKETLQWRELKTLEIIKVKPLEGEYYISVILKIFKKKY